jgi:hypothetical protein
MEGANWMGLQARIGSAEYLVGSTIDPSSAMPTCSREICSLPQRDKRERGLNAILRSHRRPSSHLARGHSLRPLPRGEQKLESLALDGRHVNRLDETGGAYFRSVENFVIGATSTLRSSSTPHCRDSASRCAASVPVSPP